MAMVLPAKLRRHAGSKAAAQRRRKKLASPLTPILFCEEEKDKKYLRMYDDALQAAASNGHLDVVRTLLEAGTDN